jgi:hypothetical protein
MAPTTPMGSRKVMAKKRMGLGGVDGFSVCPCILVAQPAM